MQPYFLPYIGYFQLIRAVDEFIVYDNIQFSKKGWFHRNRMLQNGRDEYFSLTLKKDSDFLDVRDRRLSDTWPADREKILRKIKENYRKAPYFEAVYPLTERIFHYPDDHLFNFLLFSLQTVCSYLEISTPLTVSSSLAIDHSLKSQDKVIALVKAAGGDIYLNPIGGFELYDPAAFQAQGLTLQFHKARSFSYPQFGGEFVPWLSVLDLMMFNSPEQINGWLDHFDIILKDEQEN
ncbi:MAG: WbqC family protein [Leadbetterella sp.]|nr:WbqC family protein [Leadbetterella sp.]